ncbi:MAG: glycosyltransferase [Chitinophagaceae bacterium]
MISINRENNWVTRYSRQNQVDGLISDNRWGFFNAKIPSVFITHQLTIKTPFNKFIENILRRMNYRLLEKFTECWVPDYEEENNLAGELSHPVVRPSIPIKYLGKLTRITKENISKQQNELLIILSGPEPQRSIFEVLLLKQLPMYTGQAVLVRGLPETTDILPSSSNLIVHNYLSSDALGRVINDSSVIISRSGYSTIMDLVALNKKIIFVPTPGQSEQEYLARYLHRKGLCICFPQAGFSLKKVLEEVNGFTFTPFQTTASTGFKIIVDRFIAKLKDN